MGRYKITVKKMSKLFVYSEKTCTFVAEITEKMIF
jgi:hypothetical protein